MKERPIIFNPDMVQAIRIGHKFQTRRVIKPQPVDHHWEMFNGAEYPDGRKYTHHMNLVECDRGQFLHSWHSLGDHIDSSEECNQRILCPYGVPGDRLYVRETFAIVSGHYRYKADGDWTIDEKESGEFARWKPSIHMPKEAARIWLEVVDVRVERIRDISASDIKKEGVRIPVTDTGGVLIPLTSKHFPPPKIDHGHMTEDAWLRAFWIELWDSINAGRGYSYQSNPWVWVVEFRKISTTGRPEDEV